MLNLINWLNRYDYNYEAEKSVNNDNLIFIKNDFSDKIKKLRKYLNKYNYDYEYRGNYNYIMIIIED